MLNCILAHENLSGDFRMEQFNDVLSQENPCRPERHWMNGKHINELKKREPHYLMDIFGVNFCPEAHICV